MFKSWHKNTSIESWNKDESNHKGVHNAFDAFKKTNQNVEEEQKEGKIVVHFPKEKRNNARFISTTKKLINFQIFKMGLSLSDHLIWLTKFTLYKEDIYFKIIINHNNDLNTYYLKPTFFQLRFFFSTKPIVSEEIVSLIFFLMNKQRCKSQP